MEVVREAGVVWRRVERDGYVLHIAEDANEQSFAESVAGGLTSDPKWLHCRWLYDARGSELYEKITEQPEYYLTRTEDGILAEYAPEIRAAVGDTTLVELGSGSSSKTRRLVDAWLAQGDTRYVPIDISLDALETACLDLAAEYPNLCIEGIASSFQRGLSRIESLSPLLLMFLGSTIGNLNDAEVDEFFGHVSRALAPGDHFLLGIDLIKDKTTLEAAYNDLAGWTGKFTKNLFVRMNRELGSGIPLVAVEHVAVYAEGRERVEIYAEFDRAVEIGLGPGAGSIHVAAGGRIMIEISRKFRVDDVAATAARFGMTLARTLTDAERRFAVLLLEHKESL